MDWVPEAIYLHDGVDAGCHLRDVIRNVTHGLSNIGYQVSHMAINFFSGPDI